MRRRALNRTLWGLIALLIIAVFARLLRNVLTLRASNTRLRLANRTLAEIAKANNGVRHYA